MANYVDGIVVPVPSMPFDGKRMFWGGFQTVVGLAAGH
jgi:uncharacterized protein YbaA (DUF1428 family)